MNGEGCLELLSVKRLVKMENKVVKENLRPNMAMTKDNCFQF